MISEIQVNFLQCLFIGKQQTRPTKQYLYILTQIIVCLFACLSYVSSVMKEITFLLYGDMQRRLPTTMGRCGLWVSVQISIELYLKNK